MHSVSVFIAGQYSLDIRPLLYLTFLDIVWDKDVLVLAILMCMFDLTLIF